MASILTRIAKLATTKFRKSPESLAIEQMNPIRGLNSQDAVSMFDQARSGSYARLQFVYNEIERTDPTLLVCVTRRAAALSELEWKVVRNDQRLNRHADDAMVKMQTEYLETAMAKISNLPEAIEHLALSAFRGFSHIIPRYDYKGEVTRFDLPDTWNFCYDRKRQKWLWNPSASQFVDPSVDNPSLKAFDNADLVTVTDKRAIDWPALMVFLRISVGEANWGRFLEQYGIPPVILTMPDGISQEDASEFVSAAERIFLGDSGAVPYGTNVNYAGESRGTNPFSEFLAHQQRLIVLMATGGTLTSLAESGSGTLAGGVQMDVWRQIARRDSRIIANAINKQLCERLIRKAFPGQPVLVEFALDTEAIPSVREVMEIANLAKSAGLAVNPSEISQRTGYSLTAAPEPQSPMMGFNSAPTAPEAVEDTQDDVVTNEAEEPKAESEEAQPRKTDMELLAEAMQVDYKPIADRIQAILAMPEADRAKAAEDLIGDLDGLLPDDPQMAAVIEEAMAKEFEQTKGDEQS